MCYITGMKYDATRKSKRNEAIREYARAHPEMAQAEIARMWNISRQRVWQILNPSGKKEASNV